MAKSESQESLRSVSSIGGGGVEEGARPHDAQLPANGTPTFSTAASTSPSSLFPRVRSTSSIDSRSPNQAYKRYSLDVNHTEGGGGAGVGGGGGGQGQAATAPRLDQFREFFLRATQTHAANKRFSAEYRSLRETAHEPPPLDKPAPESLVLEDLDYAESEPDRLLRHTPLLPLDHSHDHPHCPVHHHEQSPMDKALKRRSLSVCIAKSKKRGAIAHIYFIWLLIF